MYNCHLSCCQSPLPSASSVGSDESINSCKSKNRELKFGTEIIKDKHCLPLGVVIFNGNCSKWNVFFFSEIINMISKSKSMMHKLYLQLITLL